MSLALSLLLTPSVSKANSSRTPACARFRVHLAQELPPVAPDTDTRKPLPQDLIHAIEAWKERISFLSDDAERERWIDCIRQFVFLDTDGDGVPDWTAVVDGRPSRTLFPLDPDIDGDGTPNIFDADPYRKTLQTKSDAIPLHLRLKGKLRARQEKLWRESGVLVVNHSDAHAPEVLDQISSVLKLKSLRKWRRDVRGVNVLYAFGGRSLEGEIASYHPTAKAISLPGKLGFGAKSLDEKSKCVVRSSILHELGHALLFGVVSGEELRSAAAKFADWHFSDTKVLDVFSPSFFNATIDHKSELVSDYAAENVHEWFAESFAAYMQERESVPDPCHSFKSKKLSTGLKRWFDALQARASKDK